MIIGIGADLCDIERIAQAIDRGGSRFLDRVFTEEEKGLASRQRDPGQFYAGRFAAKEACAKAMGTGITDRIRWTDIEVLVTTARQPIITLENGAARRLTRMAGKHRKARVHVTISHSAGLALSHVILYAGPR
jgi:holo-[acyl-carrier protein] synthase